MAGATHGFFTSKGVRMSEPMERPIVPVARRKKTFAREIDRSESYVDKLIREDRIVSVKKGKARFILTSPEEYLNSQ
jgi:hypothetical protein